jgi:hypothetical protein
MRQHLAPADWVKVATMLNSSARARCLLSSTAALVEIFIFLTLINSFPGTLPSFPFWCWMIALDIGLTLGTLDFPLREAGVVDLPR